MELFWEFIQFIFYAGLIVVISKYLLVTVLRKLAESLNLNPKAVRKYCRSCNIST